MSSGGERHSGDCSHGNLYDWCRKDGPCRTEELEREVATLRAERDKLARFKAWVHGYLDGRGIPHHPPGTHGTEDCRIGDRMDYVWAEIDRLRAERDAAVAEAVREDRGRIIALLETWLNTLDMRLPLSLVMDIRRGE